MSLNTTGVTILFGVVFSTLCSFLVVDSFMGNESPAQAHEFQSAAAAICNPIWVEGAQNDQALNCFLTTDTARLCQAAEREHLVGVFKAYRAQGWGSVVKSLAPLVTSNRAGLTPNDFRRMGQVTFDNVNGKRRSAQELAELRVYAEDLQRRMVAARDTSKSKEDAKVFNVKRLGAHVVTKSIESLSRQGLMLKADYGWWPDNLVDMAIWGYVEKPALCRT